MYRQYRKRAGLSPERAAELLNMSVEGLRKWENGERNCPCEGAAAMAAIYEAPELLVNHMADRCPIMSSLLRPVGELNLQGAYLQHGKELSDVNRENSRLLDIVYDGQVSPDEQGDFIRIIGEIEDTIRTGFMLRTVAVTKRKTALKAAAI